mmetsp:Transcript_2928/g.6712  ORF Transcript_2928/g.6712 Transcript_2928/m.6712 type:complete len:246 (+) Transcript_2928:139-876(+)|eukprot:CAMPEP_0178996514 /NCGR_PEP_ID=MMETSP0795-20121207/8406_1 /TAXON_ID=88552 /ORGANISM="Amoebophrya sp., Strain Ameob2" /LENGTH=245 /DNA_ID=CAMNT_0020688903 /DNA_START=112 /DNA_END=849 /DNA_ORIENTATION=-
MGSSFMESGVEDYMERRVKSDIKQGISNMNPIGRPYGFGNQSAGSGEGGGPGTINWQDYNYPPYLRLIHYNAEELPEGIRRTTRCMKLFFEIQTFTAFFAVFNSFIILVSASGYPGKFFLFALLNCFMFPPAALFVFYQGYRGLAINSSSLLTQFKVANAIALLLTLLCCFVPMGAINGFGRYDTDLYTHSSGKGYWGFAIFVESMMYLANLGLASFTMFKVVSFDPHGTSGGGGQGAGMEMARV